MKPFQPHCQGIPSEKYKGKYLTKFKCTKLPKYKFEGADKYSDQTEIHLLSFLQHDQTCDCSSKMKTTKSVYIVPFPDNGIGKMVNLKVVWLLWLLHLVFKIICEDSEWGFFLMATGLLLLFSVQFFIVSKYQEWSS